MGGRVYVRLKYGVVDWCFKKKRMKEKEMMRQKDLRIVFLNLYYYSLKISVTMWS